MDTFSTFYASSIIHPRRQRGVGLLEVMIAVLVLGIGVLGVLGLQTVALKNTDSSALSSQATIQVYAMFDLLRANNNKKEGGLGVPPALQTDWDSASGSGSTQVGTLNHWLASLQTTLGPDAKGKVQCEGGKYGAKTFQRVNKNEKCIVGVQWNDSRARAEGEEKIRTIEIGILL